MERGSEERLVDLEIRYMHLENQVEELNQVVVAQQRQIDDLIKRLGAVGGRLTALGQEAANDPPPHY